MNADNIIRRLKECRADFNYEKKKHVNAAARRAQRLTFRWSTVPSPYSKGDTLKVLITPTPEELSSDCNQSKGGKQAKKEK